MLSFYCVQEGVCIATERKEAAAAFTMVQLSFTRVQAELASIQGKYFQQAWRINDDCCLCLAGG